MHDKPLTKRRWFQFSLRTMFVLVMLVVGLAFAAVSFWYGMGLGFSGSRDETLQAEVAALFLFWVGADCNGSVIPCMGCV